MSVQTLDGKVFDAIVFGEIEPGQWLAGSNNFERTENFGGEKEREADEQYVHIAIVYHEDGTIAAYRNGVRYGQSFKKGAPATFKAGEAIFLEGDNPHGEAYVIHSGRVEIRRRFDGVERVLAALGDGELLGDIALFRTSAARSAAAVAQSDVELLVIKAERLDWLIHNRPQLTKELLRRLSEMVVATDAGRGRQPPAEQ